MTEREIERLKAIKDKMKVDPHLKIKRKEKTQQNLQHQQRYYADMMRVLKDKGLLRDGDWV